VTEGVEPDLHFPGAGFGAGAFLGILTVGFGATGLFLFVGQFF